MITMSNDQVRKPAIELVSLWDFSKLHEFREVIDLSTDGKIVIG